MGIGATNVGSLISGLLSEGAVGSTQPTGSTTSLTTTRARIITPTPGAGAGKERLRSFLLRNNDSTINVRIGGGDVTTAVGYVLGPGEQIPFLLADTATLYAVAESGTPSVSILEV